MRGVAAIAAVGLGACYAPEPPRGAPCSPIGGCPSGLVCSPATQTCEPSATAADAALDAAPIPPDFAYRVPITFEATAAATDVVTLIKLDGSFPYAHAAADGADLRIVVEAIGDTPYWIESWDPDGASYVWARVPAVTAGTNQLYAYYGYRGGTVATTSDFAATFPATLRTTADGTIGGTIVQDAVVIEMTHTLAVTPGAPVEINAAYVRIAGTLDANGAGHPAAMGPGAGGMSTNAGGGGGGHGGTGGAGGGEATDTLGAGGTPYGMDNDETADMGAGGGITDTMTAGAGGGAVRILARRIVLDGTIRARGTAGTGATRSTGGGAGGGVLLRATSLAFTGTIAVNGGAGANGPAGGNDGGGGGGGGRIKLFSKGDVVNTGTTTLAGGGGGTGGDASPGQPGTPGTSFSGTTNSAEVPALPVVGTEESL